MPSSNSQGGSLEDDKSHKSEDADDTSHTLDVTEVHEHNDPFSNGVNYFIREVPAFLDTEQGTNSNNDSSHGRGRRGGGLAVATLVDREAESNKIIVSAVEFDPESLEPQPRRGICRLACCVLCFLVMASALGITLGLALSKDDNKDASKELSPREKLGIREAVVDVVGESRLQQADSPYAQALEWITHEDPMELVPTNSTFTQRYTMAYFYFATTEEKPWSSCSPPVGDQTSFCNFKIPVVYGYKAHDFINSPATRWLSDRPECNWAGVSCNSMQQVERINVAGQEMTGAFPNGIMYLSSLKHLEANFGFLRGTIPSEISSLQHLETLNFEDNDLTGEIPESLWELANLTFIDVGGNHLEGTISPRVGRVKSLKVLNLYRNRIKGKIPSGIGMLSNLRRLEIHRNELTGTIPSELGRLVSLGSFQVQENELSGILPPGIEKWSRLQYFAVERNPLLSGSLPPGFWILPQIQQIDLSYTGLTGSIPTEIAAIYGLDGLRLSGSGFYGTIPTEMNEIERLADFWIDNTDIEGPFPEILCARTADKDKGDIVADCLPDKDGEVKFECSCCTKCCRVDAGCVDVSR